jgi:hypothetical protein
VFFVIFVAMYVFVALVVGFAADVAGLTSEERVSMLQAG